MLSHSKYKLCALKLILTSGLLSTSMVSADESVVAKKGTKQEVLSTTSAANDLGIATWQPISKIAADISLIDGEGEVKERRGYIALDDSAVYAEGLVLDNGTIFYRRDKSILPAVANVSGRLAKINKYVSYAGKEEMALLGIAALTNVRHHAEVDKKGKYMLTTASAESNRAQCVSFYKASTPIKNELLSRSAIGVFCFPKQGGTSLNQRVNSVVKLAGRLEFDGGKYARSSELKDITRTVQNYWNTQDFSPPTVSLSKAEYINSRTEFLFSGRVEDASGLGFIKVNGERLSPADFANATKDDGSFNVYARSNSAIADISLVVGDKVGNTTRLDTKNDTFKRVSNIAVSNTLKPVLLRSKAVTQPKTYVLLAGISNYQSKKLPPLESPIFDVRRIKQMFKEKLKIPENQIFLEENISKAAFKNRIEKIRQGFNYKDQLIVYYSGHGIVDLEEGKQDGYWAFSDTTAAEGQTWLSNNEMKNLLSGFSDGGVFLLVDSCFSGRLVNGNVIAATSFESLQQKMSFGNSEKSRLALTSAGEFPTPDTANNSSHSEFALAVIKSLDKSLSDAVEKGKSNLPGSLVYLYANLELQDKFQASPQFGSFSNESGSGSKIPDILLNIE